MRCPRSTEFFSIPRNIKMATSTRAFAFPPASSAQPHLVSSPLLTPTAAAASASVFCAAPVAPSANSLPFSASFAYTRRGKSNRVPSS